jgi:hypothetical protein
MFPAAVVKVAASSAASPAIVSAIAPASDAWAVSWRYAAWMVA